MTCRPQQAHQGIRHVIKRPCPNLRTRFAAGAARTLVPADAGSYARLLGFLQALVKTEPYTLPLHVRQKERSDAQRDAASGPPGNERRRLAEDGIVFSPRRARFLPRTA